MSPTRFVERAWARSRIDTWLESDDPALVLIGPPGSGKSVLIGQLAQKGTCPTAVHLCRGRVLASTEPIPVIASIAATLAAAIPDYAEAVSPRHPHLLQNAGAADVDGSGHVTRAVLNASDRYAAYERGIRRPLSTLVKSGALDEDVLVAIDGVDEGSVGRLSTELADLCVLQSSVRAPRLRLLLTARPGPVADRLVALPCLDLAEDPSIVDFIDAFLRDVPGLRHKGRRRIAHSARGSFVYAALAAQSRETAIHPLAGLDALYGQLLADLEPLAADVLALLCGARDGGFSPTTLTAMLQADRDEVDEVLATYRGVLAGTELVCPHHRCLADYIASTGRSADGRIADYLVGRWGGRWQQCHDAYALRNVLPHLADAVLADRASNATRDRVGPMAEALRQTLADPAFVAAALAIIGVDDLRSALGYARHRVGGTRFDVDLSRALATVLQEETRTLRDCRAGAASWQLVYAAATLGETVLAQRLSSQSDSEGVETLWATVELTAMGAPDELRGHRARVTALCVAADGTQAVSAGQDGTTRLWRLASGRLTQILPTASDVAYVHSGPDARQVFAAFTDGAVEAWNTATGAELRLDDPRSIPATAFAVNGDATVGVSGDLDHGVTLWDLRTMAQPLLHLPHQAGRVTAVALTADGQYAATAVDDGEITLWDLATGDARLRLRHGHMVTALCLTPQADRLIAGDEEAMTVHAVIENTDATVPSTDPPVARLVTRARVTALAANPAFAGHVLFGTAMGQVAYVRVP